MSERIPPFPAPQAPRRFRPTILGRFRRDRRGVAAIEFAIVALPFFGILLAILEIALYFWANQVLETMVSDASRQIYTGQFQQANPVSENNPASAVGEKFKRLMCFEIVDGQEVPRAAMFDCSKVSIDIRPSAAFPDNMKIENNAQNNLDKSDWGYQQSRAGDIIVVRAAVEMDVFAAISVGGNIQSNGKRLLLATAVFRNEPFQ